jgi:hypothetical protein
MAALAAPLIETVAARVLTALGIGLVAGAGTKAASDAVKRRNDEASQAQTTPLAKVEAQEKEKCKKCPIPNGSPVVRTFPERKPWVDYQARIGGLPSGPTFITEWLYNGVEFDGFDLSQCLLKEAKAGYDQFFTEWGEPKAWWAHNVEGFVAQIRLQDSAATPNPPVNLEWYWQEPLSYRYLSRILSAVAPRVIHHYEP